MSKAQPRSYSELYGSQKTRTAAPAKATPARAAAPAKAAPAKRGSDTVDWRGEYSQVFGDLRQLLIITAALFVLMIILGLVM